MSSSFYDELRVVQRTPIIELKSIYGVSNLRDIVTGDVTNSNGEYLISSPGGATFSRLDTAERGPYPPGQEVEPGVAFRLPSVPTGGQKARVGYYDDFNGWYFQYDAQGLSTIVRRGGIDTSKLYGSWSGTHISRGGAYYNVKFAPSDGYVYQIPFTWYGYGPAEFNFQLKAPRKGRWMRNIETKRTEGMTSILQPHLPIRCEVITEAGDGPFAASVSGRQVNVVGAYNPIFRQTTIETNTVGVDGDAWTPVAAVRRRAVYPYALTKLMSVDPVSSGSLRIAVLENGSVPNAGGWESIADYDNSETLLEVNYTPGTPGLTDGIVLGKMRLSGTGRGSEAGQSRDVNRMPMIEDRPFIILARTADAGPTQVDVSMSISFREDY